MIIEKPITDPNCLWRLTNTVPKIVKISELFMTLQSTSVSSTSESSFMARFKCLVISLRNCGDFPVKTGSSESWPLRSILMAAPIEGLAVSSSLKQAMEVCTILSSLFFPDEPSLFFSLRSDSASRPSFPRRRRGFA